MNYVFWFTENMDIYWHGIITAIAIAATILAAAGLRLMQKKSDASVWVTSAFAIPLGYLLSRFSYWFFNKGSFDGLSDALFSLNRGGNSIFGAAFGVLISLLIARLICHVDDFTALLDAVAPAAMIGVCIGRLAGYFSTDDRGKIIENEALQRFPFAIYDSYDGAWHLSVFVMEAIAAAVIFVLMLVLFVYIYTGRDKCIGSGHVMIMTLLLFGTTQAPLEGMRLDSVFMNTLGFVRIMQISSLILILLPLVLYSIGSIRKCGLRLVHIVIWIASAGLLTLAFFMEFRIHSAVFARNYAIMITCLLCICFMVMRLFSMMLSVPSGTTGLMLRLNKHRK